MEADTKTSQFPVAAQTPGRELARPRLVQVGITERWRGGLEAPGLGALATCPTPSSRGKLLSLVLPLAHAHLGSPVP